MYFQKKKNFDQNLKVPKSRIPPIHFHGLWVVASALPRPHTITCSNLIYYISNIICYEFKVQKEIQIYWIWVHFPEDGLKWQVKLLEQAG